MRVLVAWGSKMGGTEGIGRTIADVLTASGYEVDARPVDLVAGLERYDAFVVGGGLYLNRWVPSARRFVARHRKELRQRPVWLFSSGPLDDSAERTDLPPSNEVRAMAERVGALGHVTFGGRLTPDAKGFPASAMAKTNAGDWRNPARIRAWAARIAAELPSAVPGQAIDHPARSVPRLLLHGVIGWAITAGVLLALLPLSSRAAVVCHAIAAPIVFGVVAWHYFRPPGARTALRTAAVFTAVVALLDLAIGLPLHGSLQALASIASTWLPLVLVFLVTWTVGALMATLPWPKPPARAAAPAR